MALTLLIGLPALLLASSAPPHWPQFRGAGASGIADGANLPEAWSGADGKGVLWKARIPGLAHSSPVVWGPQVFVTTAISSRADASFKPGLYGEGTASEDRTVHRWQVLSLDKRTGKVLWERTAYEGEPREKRHIKATYANATPATDGRYLVAFFGSQGIYAYDLQGGLKWKRDLGRLDAGAYDAPTYEWGTASSPILYKDLVIVQCDQQKGSFVMALRLRDGETVWKTAREELPSWATPTVYPGSGGSPAELVTNAPNFIRGYDPATGKELWRLGRSSPITAPTPIFDKDVIVVMSGRRPNAPIFVLKAGARGDITLPEGATAGGPVLWTRERAGSYMPTPLIYRGYLYVLKNQGILSCYDLRSGEQKYEQRIPEVNSGFSASPVAADGKLYLASEDGEIVVVTAGPQFALAGRNPMGQPLMATPAISENVLLVRGERDLFAIGVSPGAAPGAQANRSLRFTKRQLFVNPYESCTVGDINRDGHLDIVYGAYWFAGPDFVPRTFRPNHAAKEYLRANSDHVYDVDGDGWPDVITGGWGEDGVHWYKNPGNSATERGTPWEMHGPWEARLLTRTRGHMEMFALHDYDGDGVPELHSACYRKKEPLEVWRFTKGPDGAPALTPFVLGAEGGGHGFAFGDVNGDGREDVLTEIGWYERPAGDPFAGPWKLHPETALPHPSCPFVVKDLNKDGRLDIIFGRGHDVGLYWWEQRAPQPDGTTVWKPHVIDESWSQAHALALADLDGDGEEELVAGKCIWAHEGGDPGAADPPAIYYYRWSTRGGAFTRHTIAATGDGIALGRQYSVIDLNRDGRLDLTAPSELGLWVFFNEGYK